MKGKTYIVVHKHNAYDTIGIVVDLTMVRTKPELLAMWGAMNRRSIEDLDLHERSQTSIIVTDAR